MNSKQETLKLINLYKKYDCLWNIHSKLFRRTDIKNKAYTQIALEMGAEEELIRRKLKNLRTAYTANRKKVMESKISGDVSDDARESSLYYFTEMSFLDPCIIYRKGNNLIVTENTNIDDNEDIDHEDTQFKELHGWLEINKPPPKKSKISTQESPNFDEASTKCISAVNSKQENDEFDMFGQSIVSQLRKIPEIDALKFMGTMYQQLIELRVHLINSKSVTAATACPPLSSHTSLTDDDSDAFVNPVNVEKASFKTEKITESPPATLSESNFLNCIDIYKEEIDDNSL